MFEIGRSYTRTDIQETLSVPEERRGEDWATGYTQYNGEFYLFCNIDTAGRTGHNYENKWDGPFLTWHAKTGAKIQHPQIRKLLSGRFPVHIFHRHQDRSPFVYAGIGGVESHEDSIPVKVRWCILPSLATNGSLSSDQIATALSARGFSPEEPKFQTQRASKNGLVVYLKQQSKRHVLILHPQCEGLLTDIMSIPGISRPHDRFFYHNSSMRSFPKRIEGGLNEIPYGLDFTVNSLSALRGLIDLTIGSPQQSTTAVDAPPEMAIDPRTESEAIRANRLGQHKFRHSLLDKWNGCCAVTGIAMTELLRASHIKPWCLSNDAERLDVNNGLLLAVHIDGLFDRGLISFRNDGAIIIAPTLDEQTRRVFGLDPKMRIEILNAANRPYLAHHRATHFGRETKSPT